MATHISLLTKSTVRISRLLLLIFLSIISNAISSSSSSSSSSTYQKHCNSVVQESMSNGLHLDPQGFLQLRGGGGYFQGGQNIFSPQTPQSFADYTAQFTFSVNTLSTTQAQGVLKIQATLNFHDGQRYSILQNSSTSTVRSRRTRSYRASFYDGRGMVSFDLQGFWSASAGKLCMVGNGNGRSKEGSFIELHAVFKLNYPKVSNITTSIVTGTVESIDDAADNSNYFGPISVLGFSQKTYVYTLISKPENKCNGGDASGEKTLGLESSTKNNVCSMLSELTYREFLLNYKTDCAAGNCSLFNGSVGFFPGFMLFGGVQCSDEGRLRMFLRFYNSNFNEYNFALFPETTLVGEGVWDEKKNQLCVVGCRLKNFADSLADTTVGDCSVRLSLRFPKVLSIQQRSAAVGSIWSTRKVKESGFFHPIGFRSSVDRTTFVSGMKYEYTELDRARKSCGKKGTKISGMRFPTGHSFEDMRFDVSVKTTNGEGAWGYATPLSIGEAFYDQFFQAGLEPNVTVPVSNLNVSYSIRITFYYTNKSESIQILAEGIYDAETGILCMVGCQRLSAGKIRLDCEILINIKFAPFNSNAEQHLKGTITSTREKTDSSYFEPMELSSNVLYATEAKETIWRMDVEITMVLISLTLACLFIGMQLFYVKRNPDVLPSISLMMLLVLTMGHMIPLVLNFEAFFFRSYNRENSLLWSGGWLEVNEVIVRVVTMVAFLLQFRLLQLAFSARLAEGCKKGLWVAEKKAVRLCLLLYLAGGLIAWFIHWNKFVDPVPTTREVVSLDGSQHSGWKDLRSVPGLVLDGFLLPQNLMNLFGNSKDMALAPSFYVGTTLVRLMPHAYDAYRAHKSPPYLNSSYIYADPGWDMYSAAWDVIIPCVGLLFAILIYLQQRFGGAFFLPPRFRQSADYEKVPVVSVG